VGPQYKKEANNHSTVKFDERTCRIPNNEFNFVPNRMNAPRVTLYTAA
jgi:hypothetical protein